MNTINWLAEPGACMIRHNVRIAELFNLLEGCTLLKWLRSPSTVPFFTMQHVSSMYLFQSRGLAGAGLQFASQDLEPCLGHPCNARERNIATICKP